MSMDKRLDTSDWAQVFGEPSYGDCAAQNAMSPQPIPGYTGSLAPFTRADVAEIVAMHDGSTRGYGEWSGFAVVRMNDGRYASLHGWCDTTGWG